MKTGTYGVQFLFDGHQLSAKPDKTPHSQHHFSVDILSQNLWENENLGTQFLFLQKCCEKSTEKYEK